MIRNGAGGYAGPRCMLEFMLSDCLELHYRIDFADLGSDFVVCALVS